MPEWTDFEDAEADYYASPSSQPTGTGARQYSISDAPDPPSQYHAHAADYSTAASSQVDVPAASKVGSGVARQSKFSATVPPDTPELAEAGPSVPAHACKKPPRPERKRSQQYDTSNLISQSHVPVSWIGDSTDHADYRPANTASFSNHEADIVRVATFSSQAPKADAADAAAATKDSRSRTNRKWSVWALVGVAAGTMLGIAYKVLGDSIALDNINTTPVRLFRRPQKQAFQVSCTCKLLQNDCKPCSQFLAQVALRLMRLFVRSSAGCHVLLYVSECCMSRSPLLARPEKGCLSQGESGPLTKAVPDYDTMQQRVRRKARIVSQT